MARSIRLVVQTAAASVRTQSSSAGVAGWYSLWKTARRRASSLASSVEGATVFERRPCRQALEREAALPRAVRGPVLWSALRRLAASCAGVAMAFRVTRLGGGVALGEARRGCDGRGGPRGSR